MKNKDNIEQLFKEKLSNYKVDVPSNVWQGVQSGLQPTAGSAAGAAGTTLAAKITTAVVAAAVVAGTVTGIVLFNDDQPAEKKAQVQTEQSFEPEVSMTLPAQEEEQTDVKEKEQSAPEEQKVSKSDGSNVNEAEPAQPSSNPEVTTGQHEPRNPVSSSNTKAPSAGASSNVNVAQEEKTTQSQAGESSKTPESDEKVAKEIANDEFIPQTFVTPAGGKAPLVVELSCEGDLQRAKWDFGDGAPASDEQFTTHEYTKPGTYIVSFTGQKSDGEIFTESIQITVEPAVLEKADKKELPPALINVPNVFTPNGDGVNDVLKVTAENVENFALKVYSRGGQVVFETNDKNKVWNGSDQSGNALPSGLYFYQIHAKGNDGNLYQPKGSIQLMR